MSTLVRHRDLLSIVRLEAGADVPGWAATATLLSVTATATETSLVCSAASVPTKVRARTPVVGPYVAFEAAGPLDLSMTGILAGLLVPLAEAQVPVFALSTHDTDWILVPEEHTDPATAAWQRAGHTVEDPVPDRSGGTSGPSGPRTDSDGASA